MTAQPSTARGCSGEVELQPGAELSLGQQKFRILHLLGRGSFSAVWTALRLDGGGEVAIKETVCHSLDGLKDAENESKILQMVGNAGLRTSGFVACETVQLRSGKTSVRLAMAKVSGDSLGTFLEQRKKERFGDPSSQFVEACNFTYELLVQLVPTFEAISAVALHRDINTHNVLVSVGGWGSIPQFSIIDFGLAIDVQSWQTMLTKVPVVGDCRYWPVSAWYIFAHGAKLMEVQSLFTEYRTQLDLHAFGITALQFFMDLLPRQSRAIPGEIWALKAAWDQYWLDAYRLWEPLYKAFEGKADFEAVRRSYMANEAHSIIDKDLEHLRRSLCNARDAFAQAEPGSKGSVIFSILAELISQGAKPLGREAATSSIKLASWGHIADLLNNASSRRGSTTTALGCNSSSTTLQLPIQSKLHGTTSTLAPSPTTTHIPPSFAVCGSPVNCATPVSSPTMVISGATSFSQRPLVPVLR
jgi:serine/threonine protein kinase